MVTGGKRASPTSSNSQAQHRPLRFARWLQPDSWRFENPALLHQDQYIHLVLMAGPPSFLPITDLNRDLIFQKFGVDYEGLLFYMRLNTIGNQVCIYHFLVQSRIEVLISFDSLPLQQEYFIFMII